MQLLHEVEKAVIGTSTKRDIIRLMKGTMKGCVLTVFLSIGYLRGVEVIAEKRFTIKGIHPQTFEWENHGLKLSIPEGALPSDPTERKIDIKAGLAGQFEFPADKQLVSPVYWIDCKEKFQAPVTLELQHCAVIRNQSECSSLCFVAAKCSQKGLPYKFKDLKKGIFSQHSSYGSIQVKQFSLFGILSPFRSPKKYFAQLYYLVDGINRWQLHFVISCNLAMCIQVSHTC